MHLSIHPYVTTKLAKVFDGDYVHENPGTHLHGGIGAALDMTFQQYLRRLIPYNFNLYDVPKGKVGKAITKKWQIYLKECSFENTTRKSRCSLLF